MNMRSAIIPETTTPDDLAKMLGASPRRVKDEVRALGCYFKVGRTVIMRGHHVEAFMEAMQCQSKSTSAARSGTTGVPLPEGDYAALAALRTKKLPKELQRKSKPPGGVVTLTDRGRM
jgi:hypothetical protein